jgi:hypothetical protein
MKIEFAGKIFEFDSEKTKQTNFDKIKSMTVKEMAELMSPLNTCSNCKAHKMCDEIPMNAECVEIIKFWLESEVAE